MIKKDTAEIRPIFGFCDGWFCLFTVILKVKTGMVFALGYSLLLQASYAPVPITTGRTSRRATGLDELTKLSAMSEPLPDANPF